MRIEEHTCFSRFQLESDIFVVTHQPDIAIQLCGLGVIYSSLTVYLQANSPVAEVHGQQQDYWLVPT